MKTYGSTGDINLTAAFRKALVITDLHFGHKSNSQLHNSDCLRFVDWATKLGVEHGCDRLLFGGDWHHNRASISIHTLGESLKGLEMISSRFDRADFITGNHDLFYRDRRTVTSVEFAKHLPNIHIHNDIYRDGDMVMVPWLVGEEYKDMHKISAKHVFGHFELPTFKMNAMVEFADHGEMQSEYLNGVDYVWTGHFHKRQKKGNISYIGNAFPHDFADVWDDDRGALILNWDGTHEYHRWPDAPTYKTMTLGSLLNDPDVLTDKTYMKVTLDIPISYEEANFLRDTFQEKYHMREMSLVTPDQEDALITQNVDIKFESVDQIVHGQLKNVESEFYDPKILAQIYTNL